MIPDVLRHVITHLMTRVVEKRLKTDALSPATRADGEERWLFSYPPAFRIQWASMSLLWSAAVGLRAWVCWHSGLEWWQLEEVRFVPYLDSYKLTPRRGRAVRLGMHIRGICQFKVCVASYARPEASERVRMKISDLSGL